MDRTDEVTQIDSLRHGGPTHFRGHHLVHFEKNLAFTLIPKNASETARRVLTPLGFEDQILRVGYPSDMRFFAIIRNPFDRFVSAYCKLAHKDWAAKSEGAWLLDRVASGDYPDPHVAPQSWFLEGFSAERRLILFQDFQGHFEFLGDSAMYDLPRQISRTHRWNQTGGEIYDKAYQDIGSLLYHRVRTVYADDWDLYGRVQRESCLHAEI